MATNDLSANIDDGRTPNNGIYRGRVEDNKDPKKLGRIKVRVPQAHGVPSSDNKLSSSNKERYAVKSVKSNDDKYGEISPSNKDSLEEDVIPTSGLPWAYPITITGSGHNHGSIMVPDIGDYVFVIYENGDKNTPLYLGGCYGIPTSSKITGAMNLETATNRVNIAPVNSAECPVEVYDTKGNPSTKIIYKSRKGFILAVREVDNYESFFIHSNDQQGLIIENPRGDRHSKTILTGKNGQSIKLISKGGSQDEVQIVSPSNKSRIDINNERINISVNNSVILIKDGLVHITTDSTTIDSSTITMNASSVNINSDVNINGNVSTSGNHSVSGSINASGDIIAGGSNSNHHSH